MDHETLDRRDAAQLVQAPASARTPRLPRRGLVRIRLSLALPCAVGLALIASGAAFVANIISIPASPDPAPTAVLIGDDGSTAGQSLAPTEALPTLAPTAEQTRAAGPVVTPASTATAVSTADLGRLMVADNIDGSLTFTWVAHAGGDCSGFALVYDLTSSGRTPSLTSGSHTWARPGAGETTTTVSGIGPGDYQVRIEAIGQVDGVAHACASTARLEAIGYPGGVSYAYAATATAHVHLSARPSSSPST
jgi:hypothetical protein